MLGASPGTPASAPSPADLLPMPQRAAAAPVSRALRAHPAEISMQIPCPIRAHRAEASVWRSETGEPTFRETHGQRSACAQRRSPPATRDSLFARSVCTIPQLVPPGTARKCPTPHAIAGDILVTNTVTILTNPVEDAYDDRARLEESLRADAPGNALKNARAFGNPDHRQDCARWTF